MSRIRDYWPAALAFYFAVLFLLLALGVSAARAGDYEIAARAYKANPTVFCEGVWAASSGIEQADAIVLSAEPPYDCSGGSCVAPKEKPISCPRPPDRPRAPVTVTVPAVPPRPNCPTWMPATLGSTNAMLTIPNCSTWTGS